MTQENGIQQLTDEIQRVKDKRGLRFYRYGGEDTETGEWFPSATTINKVYMPSGLLWYLENSDAKEISDAQDKGCRQGTVVHNYIEELLETKHISVEDEDKRVIQYLEGFVNWYEKHEVKVDQLEIPVINQELGVAGTVDFTGWVDGEYCAYDWKTSNTLDKVKLQSQLTSYGTSDPFRDADMEPNLACLQLKHRTKKGYQVHDDKIQYREDIVQSMMTLFTEEYDLEPRFPEEQPSELSLEGGDE